MSAERLRVGASGDTAWVERRHTETIAEPANVATSAYIAMMHPPLALALADWLDAAARDEEGGAGRGGQGDRYPLAVADAILGGER